MGCWNETCAITNVPITWETRVVGLFTTENKYKLPECEIFPLHIRGQYNDYGGIENIDENKSENLFVHAFNEQVKGKHEFYSINDILDMVGSGIKVKGGPFNEGRPLGVGLIFILETVWDKLLAEFEHSSFRIEPIKYKDCIDNQFDSLIDTELKLATQQRCYSSLKTSTTVLESLLESRPTETQLVGIMTPTGLLQPYIQMFDGGTITPENKEKYRDAIDNIAQVSFMELFLKSAYTYFQKPGYCGQESETGSVELLTTVVIDECERLAHRYDEETDTEEECSELLKKYEK